MPNHHTKPLAAPGLVSYRCRGPLGWIMIGAVDDADALNEARRSNSAARLEDLQRWDGSQYVLCPTAEALMETRRKLVTETGYTIQSSGPASWWALLPGETAFKDDGAGDQNYLGFFSSEADLLEEISASLEAAAPERPWLAAYGDGGCWSGYPCATVILAATEEQAQERARVIGLRETRSRWSGLSCGVEPVVGEVESTALYTSRLRPEARAMASTHWANRDAIFQHWRQVLRRPELSGPEFVEERAKALGFDNADEMRTHEAWLIEQRARHAEEVAYQSSVEAQQRRDAAGVPESTWVLLDRGVMCRARTLKPVRTGMSRAGIRVREQRHDKDASACAFAQDRSVPDRGTGGRIPPFP